MDAQNTICVGQDDTKASIRTKVWDYFQENKLSGSSWPVHKRIPNYKDSKSSADWLEDLDIFKSAKVIKIDPDKPLQFARFKSLEDWKTCLVPVPRLASYFMNKVDPSDDSRKNWSCSSKGGLLRYSKPIELDSKEKVDLIIVGAVAVSSKGWRIGKGMGYSDLEYAMMSVLGFVNEDVKIMALVHDCQVIEDMPEGIFGQHDVPIDMIVTPTRVIECQGVKRPRPSEVYWNLLTKSQLAAIPALRKLRYMEWKEGKAIQCLQDETEAPTELEDVDLRKPQRPLRTRYEEGEERASPRNSQRRPQHRFKPASKRFVNGERDAEDRPAGVRKSYGQSRRNNVDHDGSGDAVTDNQNRNDAPRENAPRKFVYNERKPKGNRAFSNQGDSWLYIGNIPWNIRVSEFKQQVRDAIQMQPLRVVWKGPNGFAFLSFAKSSDATEALDKLNGMKVLNRELKVELAQKRERKYSTGRKKEEKEGVNEEKPNVDDLPKAVEGLTLNEEKVAE